MRKERGQAGLIQGGENAVVQGCLCCWATVDTTSYILFLFLQPTFRSLGHRFLAMTSCIYELASKMA